MSDAQKEVPKLSLLEQLKQERDQFVRQRDMTQNNLNQLVGAIYACEIMIKKYEENEINKQQEKKEDTQQQLAGAQENVEINEQTEE